MLSKHGYILAVLICLFLSQETSASENNASSPLADLVESSARRAAASNTASEVTGQWNQILVLAVATAILEPHTTSLQDVVSAAALVEVDRQDKRDGASGSSETTTTLVEKAGLPRLVSIALEHGAAQATSTENSLSLTATPYSALTLFMEDSQENYERVSFLSKVGVSATFALDETTDSSATASDNLTEFSVQLRVDGDRSTRSALFNQRWEDKVRPLQDTQATLWSQVQSTTLDDYDAFNNEMDVLQLEINDSANAVLSRSTNLSVDDRSSELTEVVLQLLEMRIIEPIRNGEYIFADSTVAFITSDLLPRLHAADSLAREAKALVDQMLDDLKRQRLVSLAYTQKREMNRPIQSELKFIVDQPIAGNELYLNAFLTFDQDPGNDLKDNSVSDYGGSLSWERKLQNRLTAGLGNSGRSSITLSLDARLAHLKEENCERFTAQARLTVPLPNALVLPASFRFDSRGLDGTDPEFQLNLGLNVDVDKLVALSGL